MYWYIFILKIFCKSKFWIFDLLLFNEEDYILRYYDYIGNFGYKVILCLNIECLVYFLLVIIYIFEC